MESPAFHDRLAELYLSMTLAAKKGNDESGFDVPLWSYVLTDLPQSHGKMFTPSFWNSLTLILILGLIVSMVGFRRLVSTTQPTPSLFNLLTLQRRKIYLKPELFCWADLGGMTRLWSYMSIGCTII